MTIPPEGKKTETQSAPPRSGPSSPPARPAPPRPEGNNPSSKSGIPPIEPSVAVIKNDGQEGTTMPAVHPAALPLAHTPQIDSVHPLADAREGFRRMLSGDLFGKIVFRH